MDNVNQYVLFPADQTCITEQQKKELSKGRASGIILCIGKVFYRVFSLRRISVVYRCSFERGEEII